MTIATDDSRSFGPNQSEELGDNEELVNDLITAIWPLLDTGATKDDIRCAFDNVLDAWEPTEHS